MSDSDDDNQEPVASYEVIKEMEEVPAASIEHVRANEQRIAGVHLSDDKEPKPSIDREKKELNPDEKHFG